MKKVLTIALCLLLLLSCAACGSGKTETPATDTPAKTDTPAAPATSDATQKEEAPVQVDPPAPARDTLNIATKFDYGSLDARSIPSGGYDPLICVQESLWECNLDGSIKMVLAESFEWEADDHMVVHLRKGIKFSNGNPFTASDVIFTMRKLAETKNSFAPPRVQTTDIERSCARDDYTVDWYLKSPNVIHYSVGGQMLKKMIKAYEDGNK